MTAGSTPITAIGRLKQFHLFIFFRLFPVGIVRYFKGEEDTDSSPDEIATEASEKVKKKRDAITCKLGIKLKLSLML